MNKRNRKKVIESANVNIIEDVIVTENVIESVNVTENVIDDSSEYNEDEVDAYLAELPSISARIRYLLSLNWSRKDVALKLGVIYQRVRNVEITPLKSEIKRQRQIEKELNDLKSTSESL